MHVKVPTNVRVKVIVIQSRLGLHDVCRYNAGGGETLVSSNLKFKLDAFFRKKMKSLWVFLPIVTEVKKITHY